MTFKPNIFVQISILIYVALWAYFKLRAYRLSKEKERPSVYEVEKLEQIAQSVRTLGWLIPIILPMFFIWFFPEVNIISRNSSAITSNHYFRYNKKSFYTDHYFVPFYYNGHFCEPGKKYLSNETDSQLVIYPISYSYGFYAKTPSQKQFIHVNAHSFYKCDKNIIYAFEVPGHTLSQFNVYNSKEPSYEIKWAIDTKSGAESAINKIGYEITRRKNYWENISNGIVNNNGVKD